MAFAVGPYTQIRYTCSMWFSLMVWTLVLLARIMEVQRAARCAANDGSGNAALFAYSYVHCKAVE